MSRIITGVCTCQTEPRNSRPHSSPVFSQASRRNHIARRGARGRRLPFRSEGRNAGGPAIGTTASTTPPNAIAGISATKPKARASRSAEFLPRHAIRSRRRPRRQCQRSIADAHAELPAQTTIRTARATTTHRLSRDAERMRQSTADSADADDAATRVVVSRWPEPSSVTSATAPPAGDGKSDCRHTAGFTPAASPAVAAVRLRPRDSSSAQPGSARSRAVERHCRRAGACGHHRQASCSNSAAAAPASQAQRARRHESGNRRTMIASRCPLDRDADVAAAPDRLCLAIRDRTDARR